VVVLRIVLELNAAEAARVLRIGRSACSMRLARALQKLEERMDSYAIV
jgi:DNA-directed RNA polymerase specialized sigma24 family protein